MAQPHQHPQNPPFLLDTLYCEEEHWEEEDDDEEAKEEHSFGEEESYYSDNTTTLKPPQLSEQDLLWEDEELASLLSKEQENHLETNPSLAGDRRAAVEWVLRVNAYYSFSALTAVLAVNYLDRFLFSFHFQREKPWMTQLAAVACLSLAAKVEETQVPLLLDLQVEEAMYVFEAKTIQRMEILVLSTLQWKMNPVTPLSFLDYITRRLALKNHLRWEFLRRCECLILCVIADSRFLSYLPSAFATATMLHVVDGAEPSIALDYQNQLLGTLGIDKDKVEECCKLILESTSCLDHHSNKRKFRLVPRSPNGIMDLSFSSDSSNDSWAVLAASVCSSPELLQKKSRAQDHHLQSLSPAAADIIRSFPS